jgi:hypothetical protein
MKSFLFIFVLSLLSLSSVLSEDCINIKGATKDICNKGLSEADKKYYERCCYVKYRADGADKDTEKCLPLTKYKFEHMLDVKKQYAFDYSNTWVIECNSNYVKFSLLSLVLLLI